MIKKKTAIVGENVIRARGTMSRPEVARRMGKLGETTHDSHITAIENGTKDMGTTKLVALVKVLETSSSYLLGETDDPKPMTDLEDQIIVGVTNAKSRSILQEAIDLLARQTIEEQTAALEMLKITFRPRPLSEAWAELPSTVWAFYKELVSNPTTAPVAENWLATLPPEIIRLLRR